MALSDAAYMQRALELAARGKGAVSPNPCVGCVVVKNGAIIGEGYHHTYGGPHAEAFAFKQAGARAKRATAYITLEPCSHWGKQPPCAPLVIQSGVRRVVVAMKDPNPIVAGKGLRALRKAGLKVHVGLEEQAARHLNRTYITWMTKRRPHVTLKMAMTLDGKIGSSCGESKWISNESSRGLVHRLRAESDAVLIGATTAQKDDPMLTSHGKGRNPIRVVIGSRSRLKKNLRIFHDKKAPTLVLDSNKKRFRPAAILKELAIRNISNVLIEGGGETAWPFVKEGLVDEFYFFIAPKLLGGRSAPTPVGGEGFMKVAQAMELKNVSVSRIGEDLLVHAFKKED